MIAFVQEEGTIPSREYHCEKKKQTKTKTKQKKDKNLLEVREYDKGIARESSK